MSTWQRRRTVADVMTTQVHVTGPHTPFKLLVRLIEENKVSAIPIVDQQGAPVGIVSEADLLLKERRHELESELDLFHPQRHRSEKAKSEGLVASELMTSPPLTVLSETTLTDAARLMQQRKVRRLIVVDGRGKIAGIVSRSDLLQVFLRGDEELRDEIVNELIPRVLMTPDEPIDVEVRYNVVTLKGQVDRKSDTQILTRRAREIDGVVEVIDRLKYRWDDTAPVPSGLLVNGSTIRTY